MRVTCAIHQLGCSDFYPPSYFGQGLNSLSLVSRQEATCPVPELASVRSTETFINARSMHSPQCAARAQQMRRIHTAGDSLAGLCLGIRHSSARGVSICATQTWLLGKTCVYNVHAIDKPGQALGVVARHGSPPKRRSPLP